MGYQVPTHALEDTYSNTLVLMLLLIHCPLVSIWKEFVVDIVSSHMSLLTLTPESFRSQVFNLGNCLGRP